MAKLWDTLKPIDKENLAQIYKNLTGKEFVPLKKIENLQEIDKLMKEIPNPTKRV
jgi:hypothetical protein